MVQQKTPAVWPWVSVHPLTLMRQTLEIEPIMVHALLDGLDFINLAHEGDYAAFAARYLMREEKGVRGWVFYERYAALGGDPTYIRG